MTDRKVFVPFLIHLKMPHPRPFSSFLFVLVSLFSASARADLPIRLDGAFDDWATSDLIATDEVGDAVGTFDISRVSARMIGSNLFLRFDTGATLNLPSGPETDVTLRLLIQLAGERELSIDFRGRLAILRTGNFASTVSWSEIGFAALPTSASSEFEMRVDLAPFGVRVNQTIGIQFDGSDALARPVRVIATQGTEKRPAEFPSLSKTTGAVRIASLNTLHQGTADKQRSQSIRRLFDYVRADVYCFNEEWEEEEFRRCCVGVLPRTDQPWNIHWSRSRGIASRFPLKPVELNCRNATAALIQPPQGNQLAVVSVHFDCCGHTGSKEDRRRIEQARVLATDVSRHFQKTGTVVLGDFNLVGSRRPLQLLNDVGLNEVLVRSPIDQSAITWQGIRSSESFWPGQLDYVTANAEARIAKGFTLNSRDLTSLLGLERPMSRASDHSMLVVDVIVGR
jgi:endonuclease/exonuclease/phosphatase family metal-dependent hydrolase